MKIYLDTVGCRLNQAEIESMARQFRAAGHEIVATPEEADLAVVNTCTVTVQAASDSRGKVRRAARAGVGGIVVTGCWATMEPEAAAALPRVRRVVRNAEKESLVAQVLNLPEEAFDLEPLERQPLPGLRARTRAFIKVQDGCDNACTFCITTLARGRGRSVPIPDVLAEVHAAQRGGTKEVVLTGVHLGSWGRDLGLHLSDLVRAILSESDVPRLRLSSLEPWDLESDFFSLWNDGRLCPHLHLPLQSGSARILRRMARKTTPESYRQLVADARARIPDLAITTDVIVGFPGESDEDFAETVAFVREIAFAGGHVFTYSARPGTAAARMADQVPHPVRKKRNAMLRAVFDEMARAYRERFVGREMSVLWEAAEQLPNGHWRLRGLTGNYLRVEATSSEPRWNMLDTVRLTAVTENGLQGVIRS
ncbi:MAG: tRNA (N(6)-L-threonylcarbamoyladenosine(37)-C(2))-methylthiotransferase MtaB [Anaerolineae bacterium]|nr:MAG: tRNA (N(6)-L-threonylcarbamoyladenosine(37)-C(2))-methylthiotransferase MtaB [Anaerolineae bacterium]